MSLKIRFYKNELPDTRDVVMVMIRDFNKSGITVDMLEYNNMSATVAQSEYDDKKLYIGDKCPAIVTKVDSKRPAVQVSLRGINSQMALECAESYAKAKIINKLLTMVAVRMELEDLYQCTAWHFEQKHKRKNAVFDIFKQALVDHSVLDECKLSALNKGFLLYFIKEEFNEPQRCIYAEFKCKIENHQAKSSIDVALAAGLNLGTEVLPVSVISLGFGKYRVETVSAVTAEGISLLRDMLQRIRTKMLELNGSFEILTEPQSVRKSTGNVDESTDILESQI